MSRALWATFVIIRCAIALSIKEVFFVAPVRLLTVALLPFVYLIALVKTSMKHSKHRLFDIVETLRKWEEI